MEDCVFCGIIAKKIPAKIVYEDESIIVFPDIQPRKPVHLLIVPKEHLEDFTDINDKELWFHIKEVIKKVAEDQDLKGKGFRMGINAFGAQAVPHAHIHLMGPWQPTEF